MQTKLDKKLEFHPRKEDICYQRRIYGIISFFEGEFLSPHFTKSLHLVERLTILKVSFPNLINSSSLIYTLLCRGFSLCAKMENFH